MKKTRFIALILLLCVIFTSCEGVNVSVPGLVPSDGDSNSNANNNQNTDNENTNDNNQNTDDGGNKEPEEEEQEQKPQGEYINDEVSFDVGETVYIVTSDTSTDLSSLSYLVDMATGVPSRTMTDNYEERPNELVIGVCNREVAVLGYEALSNQERENDMIARYGIYSMGNSIAIVYDRIPGYENFVINLAIDMFVDLFVKDDTPINVNAGVFRASSVDITLHQEELDAKRLESAWAAFEAKMGKEAADALKKMYADLYSDKLVDWFANLFDPATGGFYYSNSARDNEKVEYPTGSGEYYLLLPDIETTSQATGFISSSGMTYGYSGIKDALPDWMRLAIIKFIKQRQDPSGYFYHPQWTKEMVDKNLSRRSRDMTKGLGTLESLGARPTYDTPTGTKGDGLLWNGTPVNSTAALTLPVDTSRVVAVSYVVATAAAYSPHLENDVTFKEYLEGLDIKGNSYWVGNQIASQVAEIKARDAYLKKTGADYSLVDMLIEHFDKLCDPVTGTWKGVADYEGLNGLMKISAAYEGFERALPYPVASAESAMKTITMEDDYYGSTVCWAYNSWFTICNVISNVKKHKPLAESNQIITDIRKELAENAPELIAATAAKQGKFICEDGSFSYTVRSSSFTSQGLPVAIRNTKEGDVNATVICTTGTLGLMMSAFGASTIPILTRSDFMRYISIIEENRSKLNSEYHYAETKDDLVDGAVNYKIKTHTNTTSGVTAPVIKIYNSYQYETEESQRKILEHIITSADGISAGLSLEDIDYYLDEWTVHNYAVKNPSWVASILGKTPEEVTSSSKDVDLNTNDEHRNIYESFAPMLK